MSLADTRILLIEDDAVLRLGIKRQLETDGLCSHGFQRVCNLL